MAEIGDPNWGIKIADPASLTKMRGMYIKFYPKNSVLVTPQ